MAQSETFRVKSTGWIKPIVVAIAVYILNLFIQWKLFYFHYYLFSAGIITLLLSYQKYAVLSNEGMDLYYGPPFFKKRVSLSWSHVKSIDLHYIERRGFVSAGTAGGIPFKYDQETLRIRLRKTIDLDTLQSVRKHNAFQMFGEGFQFTYDGDGICLLDQPRQGFDGLLIGFSKYVQVENSDSLDSNDEWSNLDKLFINFFVVFIMVLMVLFGLWLTNGIFS